MIILFFLWTVIGESHGKNLTGLYVDNGGPTAEDYKRYVKYLFLSANDFQIFPEPLKCTDVDPEKQLLWSFPAQNEGIRICDICPNLPQSKLVDIVIDVEPFISYKSSTTDDRFYVAECFDKCLNLNQCVALSFDHVLEICYIFNTTNGNFKAQDKWTTVIIDQPTEIIASWTYTRHTRLSEADAVNITTEHTLLECIHTCDLYHNQTENLTCCAVSYDFIEEKCFLYTEITNADFDYEYGTVTAIHLEMVQSNVTNAWRFVEADNNYVNPIVVKTSVRNDSRCALPLNEALGNFYTPHCLTANGLGCDQSSLGCQHCYYPEISGEYNHNLTICKNSRITQTHKLEKILEACYEECVYTSDCIAVDVNDNDCAMVQLQKWRHPSYGKKRYELLYPKRSTVLDTFSMYPQSAFLPFKDVMDGLISTETNTSVTDCLSSCLRNSKCQKVSYSSIERLCKLTSNRVGFVSFGVSKNMALSRSLSFFRKPALNTALFSFHRSPGWQLTSSNFKEKKIFSCNFTGCSFTFLQKCLMYCLNNATLMCKYVSFQNILQEFTEMSCTFYGATSDNSLQEHGLELSLTGEIFTRSLKDLSLENLNTIPLFQANDLLGCFRKTVGTTQSDISNSTNMFFENREQLSNQPVKYRRKRFFSAIGKAFKKIGNAVIDGVKEIGNEIIDTGRSVVKVVSKVAQGDFKGAIAEIPIVKAVSETVQNAIQLGKAIASGDLSGIGSALLDVATSKVLDVIPVGRVTGKIGRIIKKVGKRAKKRLRNTKAKLKDRFKKGKKTKKSKKNNKKGRGKKCRATRATRKRKTPGSCDDDDDRSKKQKCRKPKITNSLTKSVRSCDFKRQGDYCRFSCRAGFDEKPSDKAMCKQDPLNKKKAVYSPKPRCEKSTCDRSRNPVIPVTVQSTIGKITMYVVKFDKTRKLPIWSIAYHDKVNKNHLTDRLSRFLQHPCDELKGHQARNSDYKNSGWDRGHLTPAEPMRFALKAPYLANLYINVAPQDPYSNQGPWKVMEGHVSCFMGRTKGLVATGICPSSTRRTKTSSSIDVPNCFWKMICYKVKNKAHVVGFLSSNSKILTKDERADEIKIPVSQAEILLKARLTSNLWLTASKFVFEDKTLRAAFSKGLTTVTALECMAKTTLDSSEKSLWSKALSGKNRARRKARQTEETRGCTAIEMKNMVSELGITTMSIDELKANPPKIIREEIDSDDSELDGTVTVEAYGCGKRVIGYYPSWGKGSFSSMQAQKLTHVIFSFLEMTKTGHIIVGSTDHNNEGTDVLLSRLEQLIDVADRFPHLKLMFAVGGWENSQYFSDVAKNPDKRFNFISSTLQIISTFGFDGIDIDWEYPVTGGAQEGVPDDKENYVILMRELRQILNKFQEEEGREDPYLISFAGAAGAWTLEPGYDLPALLKYADWVNVMTYDYFGAWDSKWGAYTGPPAPLYFAMPPRFSGKTNADFTMKYYVCRLKNPYQVNMGVPFYGRYWKNVGSLVDQGFSMWRKAEPVNGKFEGGFLPWKEILEKYLPSSAFQKHFHDGSKTPYAWNPRDKIFLGYEDNKSLQFKVAYATKMNLGGLMVWAIDQDDSKYSMLDILAKANLCNNKNPKQIIHKCSPLTERRWWIWDEDKQKAGMCGRSSPIYKGYYPLCDPDDPGYSCCGPAGFCGSGPEYCSCPSCKDYAKNPDMLTDEPIKPTQPIQWYLNNAPAGKRGRCGRDAPKINGQYAICNPDDDNSHCCSNGGYCGNSPAHCTCNGCVDFKQTPNFRYKEKKWWTWSDGPDKSGRCGPSAPRMNRNIPICDPDSLNAFCCSLGGYCGNSPAHCSCNGCVNFKTNPDYTFPQKT